MIGDLLNYLHLFFVFSPILLYLLPCNIIKPYLKWYFLIVILTPLHWKFFNNECFLTILTKKMGALQNTQTDSGFSETYLKWLYQPIINIIGWKWNDEGLDKVINLHWIINIILIWYFIFYKCI